MMVRFPIFASPQPPAFNFLVRFCSADTVIFAELSDAHGSLSSAPPSFCFRIFGFMGDLAIVGRDGPGDRARVCAGDGGEITVEGKVAH